MSYSEYSLVGALQPELMDWTDEQLIESTEQQLEELLGVSGTPSSLKSLAGIIRCHNIMLDMSS